MYNDFMLTYYETIAPRSASSYTFRVEFETPLESLKLFPREVEQETGASVVVR